ncbi:MAG: hypothetical protein AAGI01_09540 [Myxococcota bacterium]
MMREGLHESEAALLHMIARFGAAPELLDALEPPSRRVLAQRVDELERVGAQERASLAHMWREQDRYEDTTRAAIHACSRRRIDRAIESLEPRWVRVAERALAGAPGCEVPDESVRVEAEALALEPLLDGPHRVRADLCRPRKASGFDIGWFLSMSAACVGVICRRIGVHQIVEHVRERPPRERALWSRALPSDAERAWFLEYLASTERVVSPTERRRIELVVLRAQTRHSSADEWLFHVGLSFAVLAHGRRAEQRVARLVQLWPEPIKSALVECRELALRASTTADGRADAAATALALHQLAAEMFEEGLVTEPPQEAP